MPGRAICLVADGDRLRGDDEEPAARHAHHHVPDEAGHGERQFEPPERCQAEKRKARLASSRSSGTVRSDW